MRQKTNRTVFIPAIPGITASSPARAPRLAEMNIGISDNLTMPTSVPAPARTTVDGMNKPVMNNASPPEIRKTKLIAARG